MSTTRLNPVSLPQGKILGFVDEFSLLGSPTFHLKRSLAPIGEEGNPLGLNCQSTLDLRIKGEKNGYLLIGWDSLPIDFPAFKPTIRPVSKSGADSLLSLHLESKAELLLVDKGIKYRFKRYPGRIWHLRSITERTGAALVFERDRAGLLEALVHPDGLKLTFHNDEAGRRIGYDIVGISGETHSVMRYSYDDAGRMLSAENAFGNSWWYEYDENDNRVRSKDAGKTDTRHVFDVHNRVVSVDSGNAYKQGRIAYPEERGPITVFHGDGTAEFEKLWFDGHGRSFMSATADGSISYSRYDNNGNLVAETDPNGATIAYEYDASNNVQSVRDEEGRETFLVWDAFGNVKTRIDHRGAKWRYEYDEKGNLAQSTDPLGHVTNFRNTEAGLPSQVMRHDGLIEFRTYDDHNRLTSLIDFNSAETTFAYDTFNRLTSIIDPAGNVTRLDYTPVTGCDFNTPTRIIRPDGAETVRDFTPAGRVEAVTDGEGRKTRYHYGPYDVLEAIADPLGNDLRFQYDSQERLTCVTNQMGLHWTFERDVAGRVIRETDFDGRSLAYTHDDGGRVVRRDNPDGAFLEYDYDKSGLLLELRAHAPGQEPRVTTYDYDENGALIAATNADAKIELTRDIMGRITAETVNGVTIESDIDCCGTRSARRFDGQELTFEYDGMGGMVEWALAGHAPLHFARNKLGQELRRANGQGFALTQSWDAMGQLTHQKSGDVAERAYQWSQAYEPTVITDQHWGQKRYDYDSNGQISRTTHGDGSVEGFAYTPDLNISATGDTEKFQNWQTTAAGVVKLARGPNGEVVTLEHDACGRVVQRTVARNGFRPQTWRFGWNAQDQLVRADCPDGQVWTYVYDPFGRRISKACKHTKVTYIWDGDVIARETTETRDRVDVVDWFFEQGTFRPLARLEAGDLTYVINDHLGTPKEVVGGDGALRWSADHDTWGTLRTKPGTVAAKVETGDYWVEPTSIDGNAAKAYAPNPDALFCPIRFQGQWEDGETGLYYNRFRYYDHATGQYLSSDPIGLEGGFRPSAIFARPTTYIDPLGLVGNCCCYGTVFELLAGPYSEVGGHHLNQGKAFPDMNYRDMLAATLPGNIRLEPGSPHYRAHESLESFWDLYRPNGPFADRRPTNLDYDRALRNSLTAAGLQPMQVHQLADMARSERLAAGLADSDLVPRVPGRIPNVRNGSNCR